MDRDTAKSRATELMSRQKPDYEFSHGRDLPDGFFAVYFAHDTKGTAFVVVSPSGKLALAEESAGWGKKKATDD